MFKITIIAIGKIKKNYFKDGIDEYFKRLTPDAKINVEEIKNEPFFDNSNNEKIKELEGNKILNFLKKYSQDKIVVLDERGKEFESRGFSEFLANNRQEHIVFVIGGALGLSEEVLSYPGAVKISLSKMTLPHEMVRLVLAEQIYRAIAIAKDKKYHY
jgi:23S rRNA (pseudouridine1915-N3)-methyltransferase